MLLFKIVNTKFITVCIIIYYDAEIHYNITIHHDNILFDVTQCVEIHFFSLTVPNIRKYYIIMSQIRFGESSVVNIKLLYII